MNDSQAVELSSLGDDTPIPGDYPLVVLLVDDQAMLGEAVRRALSSEPDIHYHFCSNAWNAISVAQTVRPTVILQDLVMPDMDGLALVHQYRSNAHTKDTPIIVLSTREEPATKRDAFAAGANDYLVKLPDALELIARIRYHSRGYMNKIQRDEAYRALRESQQQLMAANLELKSLSNIDGLTRLSNRRHLDEYLDSEWRRGMREKLCLSVLMIDVDDFKRYNDTYGHLEGDSVLRAIADAARAVCRRPADLVARFGGEEFCVVLPITSHDGAQGVGEKINAAVAELAIPHSGSSVADKLTVSIGVASVIPSDESSSTAVLKSADDALYQAKKQGKNRVVASGAPKL